MPPLDLPGTGEPGGWQAPLPEGAGAVEDFRFPSSDFSGSPVPGLVEEALGNSPFLESSEAMVEAAGVQVRIARGSRLPQILGRGQAAPQMHNLCTNPAFSQFFQGGTFISNNYVADAPVSWELDLWGRLKDLQQAAQASADAAAADFAGARLSIAAQVARAWVNLTKAKLQARLTLETVESYEANLGIIQNRFEQGLASALDLKLTQASLTSARASLEGQDREKANARRRLESLLGRYPEGKLAPGEALPSLAAPIPAGIPSGLLARRPDIQAAKQRLLAAGFQEKEARKGFLPNLSLTGLAGTSSDELQDLADWDFGSWSLIGNLTQPVFTGGRIQARKLQAQALRKQAASQYKMVVLEAFREVEDALDSETRLAREASALGQASEEFADAEALAWERYRKGLVDIITPLEAQRRANEAKTRHLAMQARRVENRILLHLALATELD